MYCALQKIVYIHVVAAWQSKKAAREKKAAAATPVVRSRQPRPTLFPGPSVDRSAVVHAAAPPF
jgi:hypothetical protein